jgi:hypothetical protein
MKEIPKFKDKWEENEFALTVIAETLTNLSNRIAAIESHLKLIPKFDVNMIQYKPEGQDEHLNIKQLFDDLYGRLNKIEEKNIIE